jgi:hypothetical protein
MKLIVERTGGFAGLKRRGERDRKDLSDEQRAALDQLMQESGLGEPSPTSEHPAPAQDPGADRFTYRVEVQDEKGMRSITLPESRMPKALKGIVMP